MAASLTPPWIELILRKCRLLLREAIAIGKRGRHFGAKCLQHGLVDQRRMVRVGRTRGLDRLGIGALQDLRGDLAGILAYLRVVDGEACRHDATANCCVVGIDDRDLRLAGGGGNGGNCRLQQVGGRRVDHVGLAGERCDALLDVVDVVDTDGHDFEAGGRSGCLDLVDQGDVVSLAWIVRHAKALGIRQQLLGEGQNGGNVLQVARTGNAVTTGVPRGNKLGSDRIGHSGKDDRNAGAGKRLLGDLRYGCRNGIHQLRMFGLQLGDHLRHERRIEAGVAFGIDDILALDEAISGKSLLEAGDRGVQLRMLAEIGDCDLDGLGRRRSDACHKCAGNQDAGQPFGRRIAHVFLPDVSRSRVPSGSLGADHSDCSKPVNLRYMICTAPIFNIYFPAAAVLYIILA
ncbi:hypothetical protein RHSP_56179 [Rhizobium freirei PRF 81]|uniref:Uncharacterized protein n=1 Tax=Rhizobium freirei PRF 81 TaxID=363754 RepID=N6UWP6_9HYPH|nr:hypothetical protein RHSP_56179 [Rhizobium freirei PRF 81]